MNDGVVQRWAAILLLLVYAGLGSGALEFVHNAQHLAEDAREIVRAFDAGAQAPHAPVHDDSNCPVHSRLHTSSLAVASVPLLICLGLFVAFLTLMAPSIRAQRVLFDISCRGPPVG
jgi:hypothetical protein